MPLLEVTNGPTEPEGLTLSADTNLIVEYARPYVDGTDAYPQVYRADYDVTNGTWKPEGSDDGTAFYLPGASSGSPAPPRVTLIERQRYDEANGVDSYRRLPGIYEDSSESGTWDYGSVPDDYAIISLGGGDVYTLSRVQSLAEWTEGEDYESTSITRDSDGVVTTATVKWPDGSAGTFTTTTKNTTWLCVDAFTISHTDSSLTVTQSEVTRNSAGEITTKPALTVA